MRRWVEEESVGRLGHGGEALHRWVRAQERGLCVDGLRKRATAVSERKRGEDRGRGRGVRGENRRRGREVRC